MKLFTKEAIRKIEEIGIYDFAAIYGHELTKDELIWMVKELAYQAYDIDNKVYAKAEKDVIINIELNMDLEEYEK